MECCLFCGAIFVFGKWSSVKDVPDDHPDDSASGLSNELYRPTIKLQTVPINSLFCFFSFSLETSFRESLFGTGFKNKVAQSTQQAPGTLRFSTFGYDAPPGEKSTCPHRHSTNRDKSQVIGMTPTSIEMDDFGQLTEIPPPPLPPSLRNFDPTKKNIKMEESRVMLEIRNSAPDVIIMTSHWQLRNFSNGFCLLSFFQQIFSLFFAAGISCK